MQSASNTADAPLCHFLTGKGGVGKSTLSALTALSLARAGRRVLLLSLDPAHNQSDIFQSSLGETATEVVEGLEVREPDVDRWIARYLADVQRHMRESYTYLTALNLEQYFRVLRHSPGLEEFALRAIFQEALLRHADADVIVADMPPTALALRFFASPSLSGAWVEELLRLRGAIKEKREIITRIRIGKKTIEQDRVLTRLEEERDTNAALRDRFADPARSRVTVVVNPDLLSWMEARRIVTGLQALGITTASLAINKYRTGDTLDTLPSELSTLARLELPASDTALIGIDSLTAYLDEHAPTLHL